ncbi:MAG: calcium-binding protein, partial [Tepidisphaeraceae bacterium]
MRNKLNHNRRVLSSLAAQAEPLESRRLLAGIEAGVLVAHGTSGGDTISLRRSGADDVIVTTNGVNQAFDMDNFTGVRLEGLGGDDTFNLIDPLVSPVVRNITVLGGAGNDTISYAARTTALNFRIEPDNPDGSRMISGAQVDRFDEIETVIGGSGADRFSYGNFEVPPSSGDENSYSFRLEGRGGDDEFSDGLPEGHHFASVILMGGEGADTFHNDEHGSESFYGEAGDDRITQSNEAYRGANLDGGAGIDTVSFIGPTVREVFDLRIYTSVENAEIDVAGTVIGTDGPNRIDSSFSISPVTLQGLGGDDTLIGGYQDDLLEGGEGDDSLLGNGGSDPVNDDDTLDGGAGTDFGDGGPGNNTLISIENTPGDAASIAIVNGVLTATGTANADTITIERVLTDDVIVTVGSLSKTFDMDDFNTVRLFGSGGDDQITIGNGINNVVVHGDAGNDRLTDGNGNNFLYGDGGDDTLVSGLGNDFLLGGTGRDTADFTARTANLVIDQNDAANADGQAGENDHVSSDIERVLGGSGNDRFIGNAGNNTYFGGGGNDSMDGGGGDDALFGEG